MITGTREFRGRGQIAAKALVVTAVAAAAILAAAPANAAEPHFSFTPSFLAYTDSATPGTTSFYPSGNLPVGANVVDGVTHKTRVYFGFDIGNVQRVRLTTAQLVVRELSATDCTKPRALSARPVAEFTAANTWANPPATSGKAVAAVADSADCASRIRFDLTQALDTALKGGKSRLWIELRVAGGDENKPAFGRYLYQNSYNLEVTLTNTPPKTPTRLTYGDGTACSAGTYYTGYDLSFNADQTDADRNPPDALKSEIEYWPLSNPGNVTSLPTNQGSGGDGVFGSAYLPVSQVAEGAYAWHARTYDQRAYSGWSASCPFTVDKTKPNAPTVSSPEYPENPPAPTGEAGHEGTFLFTANGSDDVKEFLYGTSPSSLYNRVPADQLGGAATIQWRPWGSGEQSLYVASLDRAHNLSPVRQYKFNVRTYGVTVWPTGQAPDPAGSRGVVVTLHFTTQVGNGLTKIAYAIDGGAQQFASVGADGVVDAVTTPLAAGEHTLTYSGLDGAGTSHFDSSTTFYASDEPAVTSDGVYPIDGSGGGVGVEGVFTVTPYLGVGVQDVQYFTTADSTDVTVPIDTDGKARIHWTPTQSGWTYFWVKVRYTDGAISWYHSFSVTVNG
ncbi:CBM96 family carbohydrate-binding protein [Dactylosporangium sp. CA-139066]|uniref:CBM96 family carbohydrate-binding protein n=1 Tax=Dactylosporangium sp. CA-139066 TaxID=3239930 RepID=UPI003D8D12D7